MKKKLPKGFAIDKYERLMAHTKNGPIELIMEDEVLVLRGSGGQYHTGALMLRPCLPNKVYVNLASEDF